VRSVLGGWGCLTEQLAGRARDLAVRVELGADIDVAELHGGPVVVATSLPSAARLLDDPSLTWPGATAALLDVALTHRRFDPQTVLDLSGDLGACCLIGRKSAGDPSVAPAGQELFQILLGVPPDTTTADGVRAIEASLDRSIAQWRSRELWRREGLVRDGAGALDYPGYTWRDRPAIDRGDGRYLAGDMTAAPGVLSEVAVNSAVRAGQLSAVRGLQWSFPVRWPAAELSPSRRIAVLAAALPGGAVSSMLIPRRDAHRWAYEPVDEVEPNVVVSPRGRWRQGAVGVDMGDDGLQVRVLERFRHPFGRALHPLTRGIAAWRARRLVNRR
jgi:hypothetical protein